MPEPNSPIDDLPVGPPQEVPAPAPVEPKRPAHYMRPSRRAKVKAKLAPTPSRYPVQAKSAEAISPRVIEALKRKGWTVRQGS